MAKVKKTYEQIYNFIRFADQIEKNYKPASKEDTKPIRKLKYANSRVRPDAQKLHETYAEQSENLDVDFCKTEPPDDPNGVIVLDKEGRLCFTREGRKKRDEARNKLWRYPVEIENYMARDYPKDLPLEVRKALAGFTIPEEAALESEPEDDDESTAEPGAVSEDDGAGPQS